ncbi:MAG: flagellar assembly peptidoglycan hydrolase FlgJ [Gammaproteobacteria bacterium]
MKPAAQVQSLATTFARGSTPEPEFKVSDELREVAHQFEALFTQMLMKNMRSASLGEGAMDSEQGKFYRDMFDQEMSSALSKNSGLGIADMLLRQFSSGAGADLSADRPTHFVAPSRSFAGVAAVPDSELSSDPKMRFVQRVMPFARKAAAMLKVAPQFLIAQAALETGWGQHPIRTAGGEDSHNLFGIKAGRSWSGERAQIRTQEYVEGKAHDVRADFRAYESVKESFEDYAKLLLNAPRYQEALGKGADGAGFAEALQRGGYATDPKYADKILRIANGSILKKALNALKIP